MLYKIRLQRYCIIINSLPYRHTLFATPSESPLPLQTSVMLRSYAHTMYLLPLLASAPRQKVFYRGAEAPLSLDRRQPVKIEIENRNREQKPRKPLIKPIHLKQKQLELIIETIR